MDVHCARFVKTQIEEGLMPLRFLRMKKEVDVCVHHTDVT